MTVNVTKADLLTEAFRLFLANKERAALGERALSYDQYSKLTISNHDAQRALLLAALKDTFSLLDHKLFAPIEEGKDDSVPAVSSKPNISDELDALLQNAQLHQLAQPTVAEITTRKQELRVIQETVAAWTRDKKGKPISFEKLSKQVRQTIEELREKESRIHRRLRELRDILKNVNSSKEPVDDCISNTPDQLSLDAAGLDREARELDSQMTHLADKTQTPERDAMLLETESKQKEISDRQHDNLLQRIAAKSRQLEQFTISVDKEIVRRQQEREVIADIVAGLTTDKQGNPVSLEKLSTKSAETLKDLRQIESRLTRELEILRETMRKNGFDQQIIRIYGELCKLEEKLPAEERLSPTGYKWHFEIDQDSGYLVKIRRDQTFPPEQEYRDTRTGITIKVLGNHSVPQRVVADFLKAAGKVALSPARIFVSTDVTHAVSIAQSRYHIRMEFDRQPEEDRDIIFFHASGLLVDFGKYRHFCDSQVQERFRTALVVDMKSAEMTEAIQKAFAVSSQGATKAQELMIFTAMKGQDLFQLKVGSAKDNSTFRLAQDEIFAEGVRLFEIKQNRLARKPEPLPYSRLTEQELPKGEARRAILLSALTETFSMLERELFQLKDEAAPAKEAGHQAIDKAGDATEAGHLPIDWAELVVEAEHHPIDQAEVVPAGEHESIATAEVVAEAEHQPIDGAAPAAETEQQEVGSEAVHRVERVERISRLRTVLQEEMKRRLEETGSDEDDERTRLLCRIVSFHPELNQMLDLYDAGNARSNERFLQMSREMLAEQSFDRLISFALGYARLAQALNNDIGDNHEQMIQVMDEIAIALFSSRNLGYALDILSEMSLLIEREAKHRELTSSVLEADNLRSRFVLEILKEYSTALHDLLKLEDVPTEKKRSDRSSFDEKLRQLDLRIKRFEQKKKIEP